LFHYGFQTVDDGNLSPALIITVLESTVQSVHLSVTLQCKILMDRV